MSSDTIKGLGRRLHSDRLSGISNRREFTDPSLAMVRRDTYRMEDRTYAFFPADVTSVGQISPSLAGHCNTSYTEHNLVCIIRDLHGKFWVSTPPRRGTPGVEYQIEVKTLILNPVDPPVYPREAIFEIVKA
ncbi:hypothetical protein D9757_011160 [Collybiopsis confluens]|uniref:Uncharacterized protein n=1 Tax=Collybiopsis confluens TaxID=2823264 RepID=A0A8H5M2E6_9AGAR|nr:hypothetical protein D9757_011160 [Collybiopsis confluens]